MVKELSPVESRFYDIGLGLRLDMEYMDDIEDKYGQNPRRDVNPIVKTTLSSILLLEAKSLCLPTTFQLYIDTLARFLVS